jgi:phage-related protein
VWNIEYFQTGSGKRPVEEFVDARDARSKARIARTLDLLEEFGVNLDMPYARHLEKQLWELRIRQANSRYRIICFLATGKTFVLLHAFAKKTAAVSRRDIEVAEQRREECLSRRR